MIYNHEKLHQNLDYQTPLDVYAKERNLFAWIMSRGTEGVIC